MTEDRMEQVNTVLEDLVAAATTAFADDLAAIVLFGSAAENRLRQTSDVNLLILLQRFDPARVDSFRAPLRAANAAVRAQVMFLLKEELAEASELFAVKFNDIASRHRVLFGNDPFGEFVVDPAALARRLREVLLNLAIRLRERYALVSLREEQLTREIAECAGPLRSAAFSLLSLRGETAASPRAALELVVASLGEKEFVDVVAMLPLVREGQPLPAGVAGSALLTLSRLASRLQRELPREGR